MARTSMEESGFKFVRLIAQESKMMPTTAIGQIMNLWNVTQDLGREAGSKEDILEWCMCAPEHAESWFNGLIKYEFIQCVDENFFLIRGNKKHIKSIKKSKKSASKAGKIRANTGKRDGKGRLQKGPAEIQRPSSGDPAPSENSDQRDPALLLVSSSSLLCSNSSRLELDSNSSKYSELAARWLDFAKAQSPHIRFSLADFEEGLAHVCRNVPLTIEQLTMVFDFIRQDDFWRANALSPKGLMKKSSRNDFRKIDNILTRMKEKFGKYDDVLAWAKSEDAGPIDPFTYEGGFAK